MGSDPFLAMAEGAESVAVVGKAYLIDDGARRVLHVEVGRRALGVCDFEVLHCTGLLLDKVLDGRIVPHASSAYVERS